MTGKRLVGGTIKTGVVAAAAFAGAATIAWAHGGDGSLVHACYAGVGQPLIASDPSGNGCANAPNRIDWAIAGPAGPPGPAGPAGAQGPAGPAGSAADAKPEYTIARRQSAKDLETTKRVIAVCPKGTVAVAGGFDIEGYVTAKNAVVTSMPVTYGGRPAWLVEMNNGPGVGEKGEPWRLHAYAMCQGTPEGVSAPPVFPKPK